MLLSILTPSMPKRAAKLAELSKIITPWLGPDIEWLVITDTRPSGPKRNEMMDRAAGRYLCHIDDDDRLVPNFPDLVLPALRTSGADVVAYDALASFNGGVPFRVRTGMDFPNEQPQHLPGGRLSDIRRRPWHWCSWRSDIARACRFPEEHRGDEDAYWLSQLWPMVYSWHKIDEALFLHFYDARRSAFDGDGT